MEAAPTIRASSLSAVPNTFWYAPEPYLTSDHLFNRDVAQTSAGPIELFASSMVVIMQLSHP